MMSLPEFDYLAPTELEAACVALEKYKNRIAVLGGGTDIVMHLKRRLALPLHVLSLKNLLELKSLKYEPNLGFILGAMCSLKDIAANGHVRSRLQALAEAADQVASPQIRNMATIGGNICLDTRCWYYDRSKAWRESYQACHKAGGDLCHLIKQSKQCHALFQADTVPSLLTLKAKLKLVNSGGERILPIEDFYSGRGESPNLISNNELLTEIHIPDPPPRSGTTYIKYRARDTIEFPVLGVASMVTLGRDGTGCVGARFAIVGQGSKPLLVDAASFLAGLEEPVFAEDSLDRILQEVKPVSHMGVSASFKRRIIRLWLKRAFQKSWTRAQRNRATLGG
jgi:4-hydroxybenzoyl-CoA reductase subunit beta